MWRPDDWMNPYLQQDEQGDYVNSRVYEAGADAMLEALKNKGSFMTPEQMKLIVPERKYPFGWLVFIPEEKTLGNLLISMANIPERIKETNKE